MKIVWTLEARAQMRGYLHDQDAMHAIVAAVNGLAVDPAPPEAFVRGGYARLRVGDYRVQYEIDTELDLIAIMRVDRITPPPEDPSRR
ncbi:hypothetical protein GCM10027589_04330 [Actinocorallia lasiicapitis]